MPPCSPTMMETTLRGRGEEREEGEVHNEEKGEREGGGEMKIRRRGGERMK